MGAEVWTCFNRHRLCMCGVGSWGYDNMRRGGGGGRAKRFVETSGQSLLNRYSLISWRGKKDCIVVHEVHKYIRQYIRP